MAGKNSYKLLVSRLQAQWISHKTRVFHIGCQHGINGRLISFAILDYHSEHTRDFLTGQRLVDATQRNSATQLLVEDVSLVATCDSHHDLISIANGVDCNSGAALTRWQTKLEVAIVHKSGFVHKYLSVC